MHLIIQLQQQQIIELQKTVEIYKKLSSEQEKLNAALIARITELENNQKKNSSNSSKPPSSDLGKPLRTQSLRMKSGKKPGGQSGHSGETLSFSASPHEVVTHVVEHCGCCGKSLSGVSATDFERRQVYDIPPVEMIVTEHRSEIKSCPRCNTLNQAAFPLAVKQPVQYGTNVQRLAVYFTQYQLLPYGRTAEIFEDLFGHGVSHSFLVNNNRRCAVQLQPFIGQLKATLQQEPVLHADETGFYYNGQRNWLHTISTQRHSLYVPHVKRGAQAIQDMGVIPQYTGTLVHDFWKAYNDFPCSHALCNVHHLRDLDFCHDAEKSNWAGNLKKLLLDLHQKVKLSKEAGAESLTPGQRQYWYKKYNDLMKEGLRQYPPPKKKKGQRGVVKKTKTQNLLDRFIKYQSEILAFTKNFLIPFGNNLAEQAIRMMKVKQKISGCFRSEQGAKDFADIRSYIATMKKQAVPVLQALENAIQGSPVMLKA